ncbi:Fggy [Symbiodinium natans]|uniref:Fggy protein n=1 Tax=Symbiodinium natans TaxID=878477 RepID=A0A812UEX2_9DINO|nr:Fggy [Symbiodinium natans]
MGTSEDLLAWLEEAFALVTPPVLASKGEKLETKIEYWARVAEVTDQWPKNVSVATSFFCEYDFASCDGDTVTLHGLEKRPDLNGCTAEVLRVADPAQPGRIVLKLESGSQIAIRPQNLQRLQRTISVPTSEKSNAQSTEVRPNNARSTNSGSSSFSGPDPSASKVFGSAFERLKAKAEAEARGELPSDRRKKAKNDLDTRGGVQPSALHGDRASPLGDCRLDQIGSSQPAGQARRELVMGTEATEPKASQTEVAEEPPKREPINFVPAEDNRSLSQGETGDTFVPTLRDIHVTAYAARVLV